MKAGELSEKINIYRPTRTVNQFGDVVEVYEEFKMGVRCKITSLGTPSAGASEFTDDDQEVGEMKMELKCRWISDVRFDDVIVWNGGHFNLYSILPFGRREGMRLRARRRDNNNLPISVRDSEGNITELTETNPAT